MEKYNERYARHYSLSDFGTEGQKKLSRAKVLVVGAGGLGCPVLQYLAAAGIGTLGIADHDHVSLSNLQRQILFTTDDIGSLKAETASVKLQKLNPEIKIITYSAELTTRNAWDIISDYDIVVDCTDNFTSRYLINDACVLLKKPLVFGAIYKYEGQVSVFNADLHCGHPVNYRHLFPNPPDPDEVQDCNEVGVLGVLPGIIGMMQANEVIKLIAEIGEVLAGKLLTFNMLTYEMLIMEILSDGSGPSLIPVDRDAFEKMNYGFFCGISADRINELNCGDFIRKNSEQHTVTVDVREIGELPAADFPHIQIPLSELNDRAAEIKDEQILLFCQSGKRSLKAAKILQEHFGTAGNISHLKGGITALQETKK